MRLASGLVWALPVSLAVENEPSGDRIVLADESGRPLAVLEVEEVYGYDKEREAERSFRTTDDAHPGVARLYGQPDRYVAGPVTVFERQEPSFPELRLDPRDTRALFAERGWKRWSGSRPATRSTGPTSTSPSPRWSPWTGCSSTRSSARRSRTTFPPRRG